MRLNLSFLFVASVLARQTLLQTRDKTVHTVVDDEETGEETTWNFETGNLRGWTIDGDGEAFKFQPTSGDNSQERGKPSNLEGNYYVGTYEKHQGGTDTFGSIQGDGPKGKMTSGQFIVRKSSISFLIGGGKDIDNLYVGLKLGAQVVLKSTGEDDEGMQLKTWNVSAYVGMTAQIVVVDMGSSGWGHINVDNFKFFDAPTDSPTDSPTTPAPTDSPTTPDGLDNFCISTTNTEAATVYAKYDLGSTWSVGWTANASECTLLVVETHPYSTSLRVWVTVSAQNGKRRWVYSNNPGMMSYGFPWSEFTSSNDMQNMAEIYRTTYDPSRLGIASVGYNGFQITPKYRFYAEGFPTPGPTPPPGQTGLAYLDGSGRLAYGTDSKGNKIGDFSYVGYKKGNEPLPSLDSLTTFVTVPLRQGQDQSSEINTALQNAGQASKVNGIRGAVVLEAGTYEVAEDLLIKSSGVVLKGAGPDKTTLYATGTSQRDVLIIGNEKQAGGTGSKHKVLNEVMVGHNSLMIAEGSGLSQGDSVLVEHFFNNKFISDNNMQPDQVGEAGWKPYYRKVERSLLKVEDTTFNGEKVTCLTIDSSVFTSIEEKYGGATVQKQASESRITNAGVGGLRIESSYTQGGDKNHAKKAVIFKGCKNCWAQYLNCIYLSWGCVTVGSGASYISVENSRSTDMVGPIRGGWRYPYAVQGGQLALFKNIFASSGRHNFVVQGQDMGPNVFLNGTTSNVYSDSGPHLRWSTGGLLDNITTEIAIQDRSTWGTAHGWAGNGYVVWNSEGKLVCQSPPTGVSFVVGHVGTKINPKHADGYGGHARRQCEFESFGTHVGPTSLYLAQLADRKK